MNYTLHQLQIFLTITQTSSITKAAEILHLTQPAVSIQLKNLQDQFDIPLTEIIGRKLYVTDFGNEIAAAARNILNEADAINYKTQAYKGQLTGRLTFSVVSTGKYVIPYFISPFMKQHQAIDLAIDVTNKASVIESLENNRVDFALVSVLPHQMPIENVELMQNELHLVANFDTLYQTQAYTPQIFEDLPLIYREAGSGTRYVMEKFIAEHKLPVRKKMELTSNEAVKQAVIAGLGCSIMPLIGIKSELNNRELQIIKVEGFPILSTWQLIWLKQKQFSPAAKAFLSFIKQEKDNIIKEKFEWTKHYNNA